MQNLLEKLRKEGEDFISLAKNDRFKGLFNLLTDLYPDNAHFIYELLQNAEDAVANNASFSLYHDRLEFEHDGKRQFNKEDVESICSIGNSYKPDDINKIGKFGVGFKAVFAYSATPRIYSSTVTFEICNFVVPKVIPSLPDLGEKTIFIFPFDSAEKPPEQAFEEISKGFLALASTTLLFLHNIEKIKWNIDGQESGSVTRLAHSESHIEIKKCNGTEKSSIHFLLFSSSSETCSSRSVALAYQLAFRNHEQSLFDNNKSLTEQMKIVPADDASVCIYFPAVKETSNLRFHLHAPFASTVARDSVQDRPENNELLNELATLTSSSLHTIRVLDLLKIDFLEVLPIEEDILSDFYKPIRESIINEMNTQPLTPTFLKTHAPATELLHGLRDIKDILSAEDLHYFVSAAEGVSLQWAVSAPQLNSRVDKFLRSLDTLSYGMDDLIDWISSEDNIPELKLWLNDKEPPYFQKFYATLYSHFKNESSMTPTPLGSVPLIRINNDNWKTPSECYFAPDSGETDDYFTIVPTAFYTSGKSPQQKQNARTFLEKSGVREIGEKEQIERILEAHYKGSTFPSLKKHLQHMRSFVDFLTKHPDEEGLFKEYYIFLCNHKDGSQSYGKPRAIYLDNPYQRTLLGELYDTIDFGSSTRHPLSPDYLEDKILLNKIKDFAISLGAQTKLKIIHADISNNPQKNELMKGYNYGVRETLSKIRKDYIIPKLVEMLQSHKLEVLQLVWKTLCEDGKDCLKAQYRPNPTHQIHTVPSQLVCKLRDYQWVPQTCDDGSVDLVLPSDAVQERLPDDFPFNNQNGWLAAIGFGDNQRKSTEEYQKKEAVLKNIGVSHKTIEMAKDLESLTPDQQQQIWDSIKQCKNPSEMEDRISANPELRSNRVQQAALEAPEKETEKRLRSVNTSRHAIRPESRRYLKAQYSQADGKMWCQACNEELPFKLENGEYYFEAKELVTDLFREHDKNYIALCPNHAAMFDHANGSREQMAELLQTATNTAISIALAGRKVTLFFTATHLNDLKSILIAESN